MDKQSYSLKLKREIIRLQVIQKILQKKNPSHDFLEPLIGNVIASMIDLLGYLEGKNPYYTEFNEPFFHNREAAMHRIFFLDMHVTTEDGLRKIIKEQNFEVLINKMEQVQAIVQKITAKISDNSKISPELKKISRLVSNHPTFNDFLNAVLNSIKGVSNEHKHSFRAYFDAVNIIRNKVSHSDMSLSEMEKKKLTEAKFKNALSKNGELQMTFEGYKLLISDLIRFFDTIYAKI